MTLKSIFKKIIPKRILLFYYQSLAYLAAFIYGHPSRKMVVIGVTGTSGKSTVVNLIGRILEHAGFRVGLTSTFNFKIAGQEIVNKTRMTMLGRFALQKLLKEMLDAHCQYAIIETTSQGIVQSRHLGINYDIGVFTNLSPEHIESHGSFEKYRQAKQKLFQHLSKRKGKIINNKVVDKVIIVNVDDKNSDSFLKFEADKKYGYSSIKLSLPASRQESGIEIIKADEINLNSSGSRFMVNEVGFKLNLLEEFNIANALAAICVALSQKIGLDVCRDALVGVEGIPGRMEIVFKGPFTIVVDYAHTPDQLEKVYQTLKSFNNSRLICVLGATGGGRDKWKRPVLGKIAKEYGYYIIITNEDPYDEEPEKIIDQVISGIEDSQEMISQSRLFKMLDRGQAIKKALSLAETGDIVIITGKGAEQCIMGPRGEKIPWDDREIVKKELKKL